jgi:uncharacterized membrane protein
MKLLLLALHGKPGHPAHPPLTDATIGMFVLAVGLAVLGRAGVAEGKLGPAMWLALVGGLVVAAPTAVTGFADWLQITWGTPMWRTATMHLTAMLVAVCLFAVAAWLQWPGYRHGTVIGGGLVTAVVGFIALTAGGWFGGAIVFVHRLRVEHESAESHEREMSSIVRNEEE